jgi:hypothetical protein
MALFEYLKASEQRETNITQFNFILRLYIRRWKELGVIRLPIATLNIFEDFGQNRQTCDLLLAIFGYLKCSKQRETDMNDLFPRFEAL